MVFASRGKPLLQKQAMVGAIPQTEAVSLQITSRYTWFVSSL